MQTYTVKISQVFPTALDLFACTFCLCAQLRWPNSNWPFIFAAIHYGFEFLLYLNEYKKGNL